jgi:hypothetical protein
MAGLRLPSWLFGAVSAGALASLPAAALGVATSHTTLASFRQSIVNDADYEPFPGGDDFSLDTPMFAGMAGYSYNLTSSSSQYVRRASERMYATAQDQALVISFTGRPVTAFAATFRVAQLFFQPQTLGGTVIVQTNTGLSFSVVVPPGPDGAFLGFTSTDPFTSVIVADAAGENFEFVDDVYVGSAIKASDTCGDALTIAPAGGGTEVYPFVTTGNTVQTIAGVCDGANDSGPDVWYRLVAPATGRASVGTCECTFDSILRVFDSCPSDAGEGQVACNDDSCAGGGVGENRGSQVSFRVVAGEDYLVRVSGYNGGNGSGNLSVSIAADCQADFNHSGGLGVDDIFAFLNAWFAGCP